MNVISTRMDNHGKITSNDSKNICRVWLNPGMHRLPTGGLEYGAAKTDGQLPTRRCVAESCRRWIFLSAQGWCRATSGDFVGWCDVNRTACEARANHHWIALFTLENIASNRLRRLKLFWFGDITTEGSFVTGNLTLSLELRPELSFLTSDLPLHEVTAVNDSQLTYNTIYAMQCYPIVMQLQRAGERGPICGKSLYICFVIISLLTSVGNCITELQNRLICFHLNHYFGIFWTYPNQSQIWFRMMQTSTPRRIRGPLCAWSCMDIMDRKKANSITDRLIRLAARRNV